MNISFCFKAIPFCLNSVIKLNIVFYVVLLYFISNTAMLQLAAVITTGGLLLFSTAFPIDISLFNSIVNLINDSKNLQASIIIDSLKINYLYDAILGLVYIIAWRKEIELDYPEKLLKAMSLQWKVAYQKIMWRDKLVVDAPAFQPYWERASDIWKEYIMEKEASKRMATYQEKIGRGKKEKVYNKVQKVEETTQQENVKGEDNQTQNVSEVKSVETSGSNDDEWESLSPRERFLRKQQEIKKSKDSKSPKKQDQKQQKSSRIWQGGKVSKKQIENLDRSRKGRDASPPQANPNKYLLEKDEKIAGFLDSDEQDDDQKSNSFLNKWVGKFKNVVGDKKITKDDLIDVLNDFKQKLMEKNVAQQVANHVADAVGATLLETKTKSFTSVHKTVKEAMKEALRKILTPKRKIDLIVEVTKEREKLKPYVIVFVGVNGVGKSTNLAKVAYKLKNAKLSVMLAACDNFRAGAVEQIETHGRNLDIPVFQKGYKEEPAIIAYEAIKDATRKHVDAVLVDTAGRMQDNTPLMKQLANLVRLNKPNLVVFIGQALVGNDAVDQITKFNKALQDESTQQFKPQIDAILLSKFDTVDDKVGTALSLVYSTSKPILYVGVGQKYPNLKQLNVTTMVHSLLS